ATPGRQDAARRDWCSDVSTAGFFEATPGTGRWSSRAGGCGKQRMDALRRRVSHGWLTEPRSNLWPGTAPPGDLDPFPQSGQSLEGAKNLLWFFSPSSSAAATSRGA